jgi:hypothetical protein
VQGPCDQVHDVNGVVEIELGLEMAVKPVHEVAARAVLHPCFGTAGSRFFEVASNQGLEPVHHPAVRPIDRYPIKRVPQVEELSAGVLRAEVAI